MKSSTMTRLFVPESLKALEISLSNSNDIHFLSNVLRKKVNAQLLVFNNHDGEFLAEIIKISKKELILQILNQVRTPATAKKLKLIFSPIKQRNLPFIIEKATELGVSEFWPIITKHSVVDKINFDKWHNYAKEAAEQSNRLTIPKINQLISFAEFLNLWPETDDILFCNEREQNNYILHEKNIGNINLLIGPEGGFSSEEREILITKRFIRSVSLGENILRSETAVIAAIALASSFLI